MEKSQDTTTQTNFCDVATVHSVAGVFFARCCKSRDLPQRALLINRDGHFWPLRKSIYRSGHLNKPARRTY